MAEGDVILSSFSLTPEDMDMLAAKVEQILAAKSKEPNEFEIVNSITDLLSIPALQLQGSEFKLVRFAIELLKGLDGKEVDLRNNNTAIQWQYRGTETWYDLVLISDLKGDKGDKGENIILRATDVAIEWKYQNESDSEYRKLIDLKQIKGDKGDYYEFRVNGTDLEKKLTEDTSNVWTKVLDLTTLYGKTPIIDNVEVENGEKPSGTITKTGEDENGNPKYKLSLIVEAGKPPLLEHGTTTTISSDLPAEVEVVFNGYSTDGNPQYVLNFRIPKGQNGIDGDGVGNVYVPTDGLLASKLYLFRPGQNNSANGVFVEYVEPDNFPEAPDDGQIYGRDGKNKKWAVITPDAEIAISDTEPAEDSKEKVFYEITDSEEEYPEYVKEAPKNDKLFARKNGGWVSFVPQDKLFDVSFVIESLFVGSITKEQFDSISLALLQGKLFYAIIKGSSFPVSVSKDSEDLLIVVNSSKNVAILKIAASDYSLSPTNLKLVEDAPTDNKSYLRKNEEWHAFTPNSGGSYLIDVDFTGTISSLDAETQQKLYGKVYTAPTDENIIELLGGLDKVKKIVEDLKTTVKTRQNVVFPMQMYYFPAYVSTYAIGSFSAESQLILYFMSFFGSVILQIDKVDTPEMKVSFSFNSTSYIEDVSDDNYDKRFARIKGSWQEMTQYIPVKEVTPSTSTYYMSPNTYYKFGEVSTLNVGFYGSSNSHICSEYMFEFRSGATPTDFSYPTSIRWFKGVAPVMKPNTTYQISVLNNVATFISADV